MAVKLIPVAARHVVRSAVKENPVALRNEARSLPTECCLCSGLLVSASALDSCSTEEEGDVHDRKIISRSKPPTRRHVEAGAIVALDDDSAKLLLCEAKPATEWLDHSSIVTTMNAFALGNGILLHPWTSFMILCMANGNVPVILEEAMFEGWFCVTRTTRRTVVLLRWMTPQEKSHEFVR